MEPSGLLYISWTRTELFFVCVHIEHEACATDIAELKWHNSYRNRQKERIKGQVENAEMLNARLQEDIAFVEKHW